MKQIAHAALYPNLTAVERARLVLDALTRGDNAETERLYTTCPPKHVIRTDADFQNIDDAVVRIALAFSTIWFETFWRFVFAKCAGWWSPNVGTPGEVGITKDQGRARADELAARLNGLLDGVRRFGEEVGFSSEQLLAHCSPLMSELEPFSPLLEDVAADEIASDEMLTVCRHFWRS